MDDGVEKAVLEKELGALESFGEFLANGLLDAAGAGKADERAGLRDVEVAEHGEAGGDAAGRRIGKQGNVREFLLVELGKGGGYFGKLHEADGAFHHARATGTRNGDEGLARVDGKFDAASDFFTDDGAHRAADEAELHGAEDDGPAAELAFGGDDGVVHAEFFLGFAEARRIGLGVNKFERVGGGHTGVVLGPAAVEEHFKALLGVHLEMELTLRADVEIRLEILAEDDGVAGLALDPQAFGAHAALFGRGGLLDRFFVALEPGHGRKLKVNSSKLKVESQIHAASSVLIVDPPLSQYTLGVGVFHLAHFSDQVGKVNKLGVGVSAGADHMDALGAILEGFNDFFGIEHFVAEDVIDFVEDDEIVLAAVDCAAAGLPAFLGKLDVCRIGFGAADFDEAAAHGPNFKLVVTKHFGGVEFAVVPGTFDELDHEDFETLADSAEGSTQGAGGLALARAGVNDQESFFFGHGVSSLGAASNRAKRLESADSNAKGQVERAIQNCYPSWRRLTNSWTMAVMRSCAIGGRGVPGLACGSWRTIHKPGR